MNRTPYPDGGGVWAMRSLRSRRSAELRSEPLRVSALRAAVAIAGGLLVGLAPFALMLLAMEALS